MLLSWFQAKGIVLFSFLLKKIKFLVLPRSNLGTITELFITDYIWYYLSDIVSHQFYTFPTGYKLLCPLCSKFNKSKFNIPLRAKKFSKKCYPQRGLRPELIRGVKAEVYESDVDSSAYSINMHVLSSSNAKL